VSADATYLWATAVEFLGRANTELPMSSRLQVPATVAVAPAPTQPALETVKKQLGVVPNLYRLLASSPAALAGYLALGEALGNGELDVTTRGRIALTVAEVNGCNYCLSAHTFIGKNMLKLDEAELQANRDAASSDPKANAAVRFAAQVVKARGHVSDDELHAVKAAGFNQAQVLEIVLHTVLNTLTNYVNTVADTDIDFPVVTRKAA
jgi:uncharacterized peroxidase-related enzyme